jgi:quinol monooxygenase YgiN
MRAPQTLTVKSFAVRKRETRMSRHRVRFAVDITIHEGKLDEFQSIAKTMIAGTQKEPGALGYDWCLSRDRKRCRILETYADANAVLAHVTGPVVKELLPKLLGTSSISRFEVYGDPGAEASQILTGAKAEIYEVWNGISR